MREQVYPAPIRRLSDLVEKSLMSHHDITIEDAKESAYIHTLKGYIDESYEILVFSGNQTIKVKGWLITDNKTKLPIIMAQKNNKTDKFVMYCLLPESEEAFFEYEKPKLSEE